MKKYYLLFSLIITAFANAQIINFPDANFKAKLLQPNVAYDMSNNSITLDANSNGEIEVSEIQDVFYLDVANANISDLTGISSFVNMKSLNCSQNLLTHISIDSSVGLLVLTASHNLLESVNVTFDNMEEMAEADLDLSYNNLETFTLNTINPNGGTLFYTLNLSHNQLNELILNDSNIYHLDVSSNNLSSVQFVGNPTVLSYANFSDNNFSLLDLTGLYFGYECILYLGNNPVDKVHFLSHPGNINYTSNNTTLDLGNFASTTSCDPEEVGNVGIYNCPNLRNIILKNGFNHAGVTCNEGGTIFENPAMSLQIMNCPNLAYICTDETEQPYIQQSINWLGLENQVQVNSYCTFEPGGDYYTVNGNSKFDFNANGCDASDVIVSNQKFTITNGSQTGTIISDATGNYTIDVGAGSHTITPILDNAGFTVSPSSITATFPTQSSPLAQNFCLSATAPIHDFEITLIPITAARPGFDANYKLVFKNTGNVIDSGTIVLEYEDDVLDFVIASAIPDSNSGGNLIWPFSNLAPFEIRTINLTFNLNGPMETPPLNGGDVLSFISSIAQTGAPQPFDNKHSLRQTVVNSFDPNDKTCLEGQNLSNDFLGGYVSYQIRFENTGSFAAENIVVKDMIDTTKFDIATLTPVSGSHHFYTRINGNKVEFIFENINLPFDDANNDGYAVFKIKLLPGVTENIPFSNQASIYFDYNFPIVTNTATSVIGTLGMPTLNDNLFTIFPVPAKNVLQIQAMENLEIKGIEIYNNLGQIVQKELGNQHSIDVSKLLKGVYYLKIKTADATSVKQFLKE